MTVVIPFAGCEEGLKVSAYPCAVFRLALDLSSLHCWQFHAKRLGCKNAFKSGGKDDKNNKSR